MTQQIQTLIEEHGCIRRVLSCFETQLDSFERTEVTDYKILEESIAYCQEYLDRWHHPRENALFDLLRHRAPVEAEPCTDLEDQRLGLASATKELVAIFGAVQLDAEYSRADLVDRGRKLLNDYRRHLEWEEAGLFSAVADHFLAADWRELARRFADITGPMARNPVEGHYQSLFYAIEES